MIRDIKWMCGNWHIYSDEYFTTNNKPHGLVSELKRNKNGRNVN